MESLPKPLRLNKRTIRILIVVCIVAGLIPSATAYQSGGRSTVGPSEESIRAKEIPDRNGITVVTTDAFGGGRITAFNPDGEVMYYADEYSLYHDVDPSPTGKYNVTYVATEYPTGKCSVNTPCAVSFIERVNLSTGEKTRLWERTRPVSGTFAIHDADRIGPHRFVVADIAYPDSAYIINTTSGVRQWYWTPEEQFPISGGGAYPNDWTHVNNVQYLENGTVIVSLRNQDQVVFIDNQTGVIENMTLGSEDNHSTLYEQHNPDYIPSSRGGPALLVADSENGRIIEYQRRNGSWVQSWTWRDAKMQWPRDADRLKNGNTLIVDTNSDRVVEINQSGEIVWQMQYPGPYEVERLPVSDESVGQSAQALDLQSRGVSLVGSGKKGTVDRQLGLAAGIVFTIQKLIPRKLVNAILYVLPPWASPLSVLGLAWCGSVLGLWGIIELRWSRVNVRSPITLTEQEE